MPERLLCIVILGSAVLRADVIWREGFENGWGDWSETGGAWQIGVPTSGPNGAHTASQVVGTILSGNVPVSVNASLFSPSFAVPPSGQQPRLRFWSWHDTCSSGDYGEVWIRPQSGTWTNLTEQISGHTGGAWMQRIIDLSTYGGQTVQIAFQFVSDQYSCPQPGWYIDDVSLETGPLTTDLLNNPEGFENGWGDWSETGGTWQIGAPTSGPNGAHTGARLVGTILSGDVPVNVDAALFSPWFAVPAAALQPRLRFWSWHDTCSAGDFGKVWIRPQGGTWTNLTEQISGHTGGVWMQHVIDLSTYGGQTVQIGFQFVSDQYSCPQLGWYIDDISVETGPLTIDLVNNPEGFENGWGDWSETGGTWQIGVPTSGPNGAHTGGSVAGTILNKNHPDNVNASLFSPWFAVPSAGQQPRLRFWSWHDTCSAGDYGEVWIRSEGGTWTNLTEQISGHTGGAWMQRIIDLSTYGGQTVQIAFQFVSDQYSCPAPGWYIDDISVETGPLTIDLVNIPEGFENGWGDWSETGGAWQIGVPTSGPNGAHTASQVVGTILSGNVPVSVNASLFSPSFAVPPAGQQPRLRFWSWHDTCSSGDYGEVWIRPQSGTWTNLTEQISGHTGGAWMQRIIDLSTYGGQTVQIAFQFVSDQYSCPQPGWYIDDVSLDAIVPPPPSITSVSPDLAIGSDSPQPFFINGANFVAGCNVILRDLTASQTFPNRTITSFGSTQIRIDPIFTTAAHDWSVQVANPDGQSSGQFNFSVVAPSTPPTITEPPQSQTVQAGENITLTVGATGTPPLSYQWRFNGQNIPDATSTNLSLFDVQFTNAGNYSVVVSNSYNSAISSAALLTVYTNLLVLQTNREPTSNEIGQPTIPTDNHLKVFTEGVFTNGLALDPNVMTVVLTHGLNENPNSWVTNMAGLIVSDLPSLQANIVAWDWSSEAYSRYYLDLSVIADKTPGEGWALSRALIQTLGQNYSKPIHFFGHSLGTLVNGAAARYLQDSGFSWTNMQMTLFDEAEVAWGFNGVKPEVITTLPTLLGTLSANFSTSEPFFYQPLPRRFAWADNYVSAFGLLHPEAANVILTNGFPADAPGILTWWDDLLAFHDYPMAWYNGTVQTDISTMGFRWSFERGGAFDQAPPTNSFFIQAFSGSQWSLVRTDFAYATDVLNGRFSNYFKGLGSIPPQIVDDVRSGITAYGQVVGQLLASAPANEWNFIVRLFTSGGNNPQIQKLSPQPLGNGPNGPIVTNVPAYAWMQISVPSNAASMAFDFMLEGDGKADSFQVALDGTNVLSLEASLVETNVPLNSGLLDVSQYAGQQVELFLGIVGGTSTNASLTVSNFQFYVALPPILQARRNDDALVLSWPLSAQDFNLQATTNAGDPNSWATVTNVPAIVNLQNTVTNTLDGGSQFYRLRKP